MVIPKKTILNISSLDETRRKNLENIKGKQQDKDIEERYFKNGYREQYSLIVPDRYLYI